MDTNTQSLPAPTPHKQPIPIDLLVNYANQGLSYREIGKLAGCSHVNVIERLQTFGYDKRSIDSYKANRADILSTIGRKILYSLTDSEIQKMAPRDKVLTYGILYDKERTERGLANTITAFEGLPDQGLSSKIAGSLERASRIGIKITEIVGDLPASLREEVAKLLPQSHDNQDNIADNSKCSNMLDK